MKKKKSSIKKFAGGFVDAKKRRGEVVFKIDVQDCDDECLKEMVSFSLPPGVEGNWGKDYVKFTYLSITKGGTLSVKASFDYCEDC